MKLSASLWNAALNRRVLRKWREASLSAADAPLSALRAQRQTARELKRHLDQFAFVADGRLALPLIGAQAMQVPPIVIGHCAQKYGVGHRRVAALQRCKIKSVLAMKQRFSMTASLQNWPFGSCETSVQRIYRPTGCGLMCFTLMAAFCLW